ncbi:alpha/beta hydrolase [Arthrobacter sp. Br18]|uniref:alpha/beta hydrolase n=1 Tax=Arthrobacter sp. Br18 TaxID=1312954 RepID=UPI00047D0038|nr:alpha/beta hydrolase [Arthrobacter sp. Br18]
MKSAPGSTAAPFPRRCRWGPLAAGSVLVLALSGCSLLPAQDDDPAETGVASADPTVVGEVPGELDAFYSQQVVWEPCEEEYACTTVEVPLDYGDPERDTIEIAAIRADAGGEAQGTVLVNPGGPGASGYNIVKDGLGRVASEALREAYDVVGFDPRGVNRSSAVECRTDAEKDVVREEFIPAGTSDEDALALVTEEARAFADLCAERTGELLGYVDTESAARDMDILRAVVNDPQLNFLGFSYGTQLGAAYAELFPDRVGRMVLDGAIDPSLSSAQLTLGQAAAFEESLRAYVADCQSSDECPLPGSVDDGVAAVQELFAAIEQEPQRAEDGRLVTVGTFVQGFIFPLYDNANWPALTTALTSALGGDVSDMLYLADLAAQRSPDGTYSTNSAEAFIAINCLDYPMASDPAQLVQEKEELVAASPTFGALLAYGGANCAPWEYGPVLEPEPASATGAGPMLVIGTTGDPATPYEWSLALADQLESSVHVTWEGEGHTAYGRSNECIGTIVDSYFLDGTVPEDGVRC